MNDGVKECRSCRNLLPVSKFKPRAKTGRQAGQRNSMCNRCLYVRYTRPDAQRKTALVQAYKLELGCSDCGYRAHPAALEFDHLPGHVKRFNVMEKVGSYSLDAIWDEIAKCEVVCANCHAIRTTDRRSKVEVEVAS